MIVIEFICKTKVTNDFFMTVRYNNLQTYKKIRNNQEKIPIYFFQKAGVKSRSTVNNSKRPTSIINERNHLLKSGIAA